MYADQIIKSKLYGEIDRSAGRDGLEKSDLEIFRGLIVSVANEVGAAMTLIPGTFKQYTVHDIRHVANVINLMGLIIPPQTLQRLNAIELAILILGALLHDVGMIVGDAEKEKDLRSQEFAGFCGGYLDRLEAIQDARSSGQEFRARAIEDALLAEYYRRLHPERVWDYVRFRLHVKLRVRDFDLSDVVCRLCESHAWGFRESTDPRSPNKAVVNLDYDKRIYGAPVNLQYLSCCLRMADIMDFDRSRSPLSVFQQVDFSESRSWEEWNKHLSVQGWKITPHEIGYEVSCSHPSYYVAVHSFLDQVDDELRQSRYLIDSTPRGIADRYKLFVPHIVDRRKVGMEDSRFIAGGFKFRLAYEEILRLLMDRSLYPDPGLFLRELLQNAIDACRRKEALAREKGAADSYRPSIAIWDYSSDVGDPRLVFQDNGIGMSLRIVENYFMNVGKSFYRSMEFDVERRRLERSGIELDAISQFGIGILSCFLVADHFEVETHQFGFDPLHIRVEGIGKYFVIQKLERSDLGEFTPTPRVEATDGPPLRTGTRITLHLRSGVSVDPYEIINRFSVNVDYPISIYHGNGREPRKVLGYRWEEELHLADFAGYLLGRREEDQIVDTGPLDSVIIPSVIPFTKWPFSAHLRARAWLWLLRGQNGRPCPQRGYLKIGSYMELNGLAAVFQEVEELLRRFEAQERAEVGRWLVDVAQRIHQEGKGGAQQEYFSAELLQKWAAQSSDDLEALVDALDGVLEMINQLNDVEFKALLVRLRQGGVGSGDVWFKTSGVPEQLLTGSLEWAPRRVRFSTKSGFSHWFLRRSFSGPSGPQEFALHSIQIPGGIVDWKPEQGEMGQVVLLDLPGGIQIDARGRLAPVPSASRLFIPLSEGKRIIIPYARAIFRHAADLVGGAYGEESWRSWFKRVFGSLQNVCRSSGLAIGALLTDEDLSYGTERYRYKVRVDGKYVFLKGRDLEERFGQVTPIARKEDRVGLASDDVITSIMDSVADCRAGNNRPGSGRDNGPWFLSRATFGEWP